MQRRAAIASLVAVAALGLAGCGFELRRSQSLAFKSIALVGFTAESQLRTVLERELRAAGIALRDNPAQAEVVLDALGDARQRTVAASTSAGQVREIQLRVRLRFRASTPAGAVLLPPADLLLTRDLSYTETAALAKQQEEALLFRAMEDDIVAQVLRRLAAIKLA
jgi:LPS-assembly lipoprotein